MFDVVDFVVPSQYGRNYTLGIYPLAYLYHTKMGYQNVKLVFEERESFLPLLTCEIALILLLLASSEVGLSEVPLDSISGNSKLNLGCCRSLRIVCEKLEDMRASKWS